MEFGCICYFVTISIELMLPMSQVHLSLCNKQPFTDKSKLVFEDNFAI